MIKHGYLTPKSGRRRHGKYRPYSLGTSEPSGGFNSEQYGQFQHADADVSYLTVHGGAKHKKKGPRMASSRLLIHWTEHVNTVSTGYQAVDLFPDWLDTTQMLFNQVTPSGVGGAPVIVGGLDKGLWPYNLFAYNPNQYITSNETAQTGGLELPLVDQAYIETISGELCFTSCQNVAQELDILFFMSKRDLATTKNPRQVWQDCLFNAKSGAGPTQVAAQPLMGTSTIVPGAPIINDFGESPYFHPDFNKLYTTVGKKKLILQSGGIHKIKYKYHVNRYISRNWLTELFNTGGSGSANGVNILKGLTLQMMVIARGFPTPNTNVTALGAKTTVTPIDYVVSNWYNVRIKYPSNQRLLYNITSDAGFVGDTAVADSKIVNDTDTAVSVFQN